ncbi:COP9 signalosome complex subunit 1 [Hibiscus syriacus]|uniref:COP9 signalosome complex subunit 1 n=1 Tax=Hibiscus syriacus TaxID=106335 RepID=A0A6A3D7Q8_HIBSY|nr:COP9 signalosome complex subunit 1 [Hibiscus syriacus]
MVGEDNISNPLMEDMCANDIGDVDDAPSSSTEQKLWPIISGEHLEIEAYAAFYSGCTKIMRLIFIVDHCDNTTIHLESLRMAYDELKKGENNQLFCEIVQKIDDYCTTSKHIIQMCLSAILVSIEMGQFSHVRSYISKAEQTPKALDPPTTAKLRCAAGLLHLESKKYKLAARKFLEVGPELGNSDSEVIAPQDVATLVFFMHLQALVELN